MMATVFCSFDVLTFGGLTTSGLANPDAFAWYLLLAVDFASVLSQHCRWYGRSIRRNEARSVNNND